MDRPDLEFHPEAIEEARAARQWYKARSPAAAEAFMAELDTAVNHILEAPEFSPGYLHGTRRYLLRRFPYIIVFRHTEKTIQIIAVAHGRRQPGYWKDRSRE